MNFFWDNVFEYWKERRYAFIFISTLAAFFGIMIAGAIGYQVMESFGLWKYLPLALPGTALLLLALIWRGFRQARQRRSDRYKSSLLSRDELSKARSKLRKKESLKKI